MLFNLFFADKIYVTIFKNKLKSPEFAKELRDAKNGSHIEALHACFYNRQLVIKNKPLNTAGVLGGDNKVIFHLLINLRSKMVNWSKMASGQKWSKQFFLFRTDILTVAWSGTMDSLVLIKIIWTLLMSKWTIHFVQNWTKSTTKSENTIWISTVNPYWQILENSSNYFSEISVFWVVTQGHWTSK